MTGRDLIIFILTNKLEDSIIFKDNAIPGLVTENQLADKFNVGIDTIKVWNTFKYIEGVIIGNTMFYPENTRDPRTTFVYYETKGQGLK